LYIIKEIIERRDKKIKNIEQKNKEIRNKNK
jgi:hypothetical protein